MGPFNQSDLQFFRATALLACGVAFIGLIILVIWIFSIVLSQFYSLLLPLAIAGVMALILDPMVRFFQRILKARRLPAVILTIFLLLGIIGIAWLLILPELLEQFGELFRVIPKFLDGLYRSITNRFPFLLETILSKIEEDIDFNFLAIDGKVFFEKLGSYSGILVGMAFIPLFLFFMLIDGKKFWKNAPEVISMLSRKKQEEIIYLITMFIGYITAFFQGQLVIALIVGVMLAIGFTIIGLQAAIILGMTLGMLAIVPFLGVIVGLGLALPVAWIQPGGGLQLVGLTLIVFCFVQIVESWILTPRIMSERSGLNPAIVVISLFFWGTVFGGVIGIILAVPITAFLASLWWHLKSEYFSKTGSTTDHE